MTKEELTAWATKFAAQDEGNGPPGGGPPGGQGRRRGQRGRGFGGRGFGGFGGRSQPGQIMSASLIETLKLTAEQKKTEATLQKHVDEQLGTILTPKQKQRLKDLGSGGGGPGGFGPGGFGPGRRGRGGPDGPGGPPNGGPPNGGPGRRTRTGRTRRCARPRSWRREDRRTVGGMGRRTAMARREVSPIVARADPEALVQADLVGAVGRDLDLGGQAVSAAEAVVRWAKSSRRRSSMN